jgi:hypothetical protein
VLANRGEYEALLSDYPRYAAEANALLPLGDYDFVRQRYPLRHNLAADLLLQLDRYEEVLAHYQDQRSQCAAAMVALADYEKVLGTYPENRAACARALLGLGRFDEAWQKYPEHRGYFAWYLVESKRHEDAIRMFPDQTLQRGLALLAQKRHRELPLDTGAFLLSRTQRHEVATVWALEEHVRGNRRRADSLLSTRPVVYIRKDDAEFRFSEFVLPALLRAFDGNRSALGALRREVSAKHRHSFEQRLWHEVGYLAGQVTEEQFLTQPYRLWADKRLALLRPLRADIREQRQEALAGYRAIDWPVPYLADRTNDIGQTQVERELVRWRMNVCAGGRP